MNSEIDKKIEQLLLFLRSTDPAVRYKALHKLNQILLNDEFEQYKNVIIQNISKYSSCDTNEKIRLDAKNILYMHGELVEASSVKKLNTSVRSVIFVFGLLFVMLLVIYLVIPEGKKEETKDEKTTTQIVKNSKKYSLKFNVSQQYSDNLKVEIQNKVVFKGKPLFTNITNFRLNRNITKVYKNGFFVMKQKITEGFGITSDLHGLGYPNPGENLYVTYSPLGKVKSVKIDNKHIENNMSHGFSKIFFPKQEIVVGDTWNGGNDSDCKFNNVVYANKYKLIQLFYESDTPMKVMENKKMSTSVKGEIYLDFKTKLPLFSKTTTSFRHNSHTSSVSMNTITTITETSSKLDSLKFEAFLGDHLTKGILQPEKEVLNPKGVTQ